MTGNDRLGQAKHNYTTHWDGHPGWAFIALVIHLTRMRLLAALALVLACVAIGCNSGAMTSKDGAVLFDKTCAQCHGRDGKADPIWKARLSVPDLSDPALQGKLSDDQMMKIIQDGSENRRMPPWRGAFNEEQVRALVAHVRTLRK